MQSYQKLHKNINKMVDQSIILTDLNSDMKMTVLPVSYLWQYKRKTWNYISEGRHVKSNNPTTLYNEGKVEDLICRTTDIKAYLCSNYLPYQNYLFWSQIAKIFILTFYLATTTCTCIFPFYFNFRTHFEKRHIPKHFSPY